MALAILLLFVAVVAGLLASGSGYSVISARTRAGGESASTMALLAAESGLARVDGALKGAPLVAGGVTASGLDAFLTGKGLNSVALDNGGSAAVQVVNVQTLQASPLILQATFKSTGTSSGAQKVVLKDYLISETTANTAIQAGGAVTSQVGVTVNGQPSIPGINGATATGVEYDVTLANRLKTATAISASGVAYTTAYTVTVTDPLNAGTPTQRIDAPPASYIEVGSSTDAAARRRFKVTAKSATQVTLQPVNTTFAGSSFSASLASASEIGVIPVANTQAIASFAGGTGPQVLAVTDPRWFAVGQRVHFNYLTVGGSGTANGEVQATDPASGTMTLKYDCTGCAAPPSGARMAEGTPLRRTAPGIVTGGVVTAPSNPNITTAENSPLPNPTLSAELCPSGKMLFCSTMGVDFDTFLKFHPVPTTNPTSLNGLSGTTVINGGTWNGTNGLCGSGILVVVGNFDIDSANCGTGNNKDLAFNGLIFVTGTVALGGNFTMNGALVTSGTSTRVGGTQAGGNGNGNGAGAQTSNIKVNYDPMALNAAGNLCCAVLPKTVAGSWRQQ